MNFTTAWINIAGLQGFERAYYFYILGQYITPHTLQVSVAYDYNPSATQNVMITPDNYAAFMVRTHFMAIPIVMVVRVMSSNGVCFYRSKKCQAFQLTVQENFDATYGTAPGAGLTLSGLDLVIGIKKGYPVLRPSRSVG
jgi:hypothetical protein